MDSEDQLVERTGRAVPSRAGKRATGLLRLGIGDDAAIIAPGGRTEWVLTCDQFLEGVHFLADTHPPDSVGYKALVRATSDIAAMGASPRFFLLALALPSRRTGVWLDAFLRGMGRAARLMGLRLIGGDTTELGKLSINITVLGEIEPGSAITRAAARPGDIIYVSGKLGRAQLGLELIRNKLANTPELRSLLRPHLYPQIRLRLGAWLARNHVPSAMMDISDGLSTDLARLCKASRVGARIWADRIPQVVIPPSVTRKLPRSRLDPLQMALHGGDDYELLLTVSPSQAKRLQRAPGFRELSPFGKITRGRQIILLGNDGSARILKPGGWDRFRRR
jgi:thiamine-monophosphate kinase